VSGPAAEQHLADLRRHADDFVRRACFALAVLDLEDDDVIGCVCRYPTNSAESSHRGARLRRRTAIASRG
jgi:capsid protein